MLNKKNKAFSILYLLVGALISTSFIAPKAHADCTSPAAPSGIIEYFSASEQIFKYCNGTDWIPWGGGIWSDSGSGYIEYSSTLGGIKVAPIVSAPAPDGAIGATLTPPSGSDSEIQFNSGGVFGSDADLTWDVGSNTMNTINIDYSGYITDVSDKRLKENILPLEKSFEGIMALDAYSFTMKNDEAGIVEYGLMAQDVQAVFPELVKTHDNGMLSLNYTGLIAPLIETVKTQQAEIELLKKRLEALESNKASGFDDPKEDAGE